MICSCVPLPYLQFQFGNDLTIYLRNNDYKGISKIFRNLNIDRE